MLIAVEGIDGAGKTTISNYIAKVLRERGYDVVVLKEPSDSEYGRVIKSSNRRLDPERELELFILDRIEDVRRNILPALKSGKVVIMDRYYYSNIAYQSAVGLDGNEIKRRNKEIAPQPDLTILLDVDPETALKRIVSRGKLTPFEKLEYLRKVREKFLEYADDSTVIVDASKPLKEVENEVERIVTRFLRSREEP